MKTRLNLLDSSILAVVVVGALGFGMAKAGSAGVDQAIEGKARVNIDIFLVGVKTSDPDLFKVGDKTALTIRNVPVEPKMAITAVKHTPKQVAFLAPDGSKVLTFPDPTQPLAHDFVVTVQEEAEVTKDGVVIRGNKLKIGNQVEVEDFKYRIQGVVVGISTETK